VAAVGQSSSQGAEVEPAVPPHDEFAVDHRARLQLLVGSLGDLGEPFRQGGAVA